MEKVSRTYSGTGEHPAVCLGGQRNDDLTFSTHRSALPCPKEPAKVEDSSSTTPGHFEATADLSKDPGFSATWKGKQTTSGTTASDKVGLPYSYLSR